MLPLVSVIMPAYNAEKYIGAAITSILNQSYSNFELIIVNDASTDRTLNIIQSFDDSRINLLQNDKNKGIAYSTNRALEVSKGKYIALLDNDDVATEDRLLLQVDYMEKNKQVDILGGRSAIINENGVVERIGETPRNNPKYIKAMLLFNNHDFCNGTAMIRADFIQKNHLKYEENCYGMQDFKFYIDSSKLGIITTIDKLLLYYRRHTFNETKRQMNGFSKERREAYARFQRESLKKSGFHLTNEELQIINDVLTETKKKKLYVEDIYSLYDVFQTILLQAQEMKIDYYNELELLCKKKIGEKLLQVELFKN